MYQRKGIKRKASFKGRRGGFKKRRGFGSSRGPSYSSPFGPTAVQYGAGKGITDQAVLYKTIGIPGRLCLKLRTSFSGSLSSTSGAFSTGNFLKLNSIFDPAGASGAIRASAHYTWFGATPADEVGVYISYMVTAASAKVWLNAATANTVPVNVAMRFQSASSQDPATFSEFTGNPLMRQTCVGLPAGGQGQKVISLYATIAQVMSDSMASVVYDDTFAALSNTDPASLAEADICIQSTDATTTTNVFYRCELVQWVCMFGRKRVDATSG